MGLAAFPVSAKWDLALLRFRDALYWLLGFSVLAEVRLRTIAAPPARLVDGESGTVPT